MKKLLLGLGTLASVAAPVAAVIACGSDSNKDTYKEVEVTSVQGKALAPVSDALASEADTLASGSVLLSTKIKGDSAQFTFGQQVTPDSSDEADTNTAQAVRYTVNLSTGKVTSIELSTDGSTFNAAPLESSKIDLTVVAQKAAFVLKAADIEIPTKLADAPTDADALRLFNAANTAIDAATSKLAVVANQATLDEFKTAVDDANTAVKAFNDYSPAATGTTNTGAMTQADVTAEVSRIEALGSSLTQLDKAPTAKTTASTFSEAAAKELGFATFKPGTGFNYKFVNTDSTVTITVTGDDPLSGTTKDIDLNIKAAAVKPSTPDAGKTTVPGAGTPAAVTKVADAYDDSTKTVSVTIDVDANDFENHIAGEAALAIQTVMAGKDIADIEHVTITINDGTTTETNTADVATQTATSTDADIIVKQKLNGAINAAAEKDAEADLHGHDMALNSPDYVTTMVARIKAVDAKNPDFNFANKILEAIGNATRFTSATEIQPVFAASLKVSLPSVKEELENMLKVGSFGTFDPAIAAELTAQFAKITD